MTKHALPTAIAIAVPLVLALSCVTSKPTSPAPLAEADIIMAGAQLFAEGKVPEAKKNWAGILDAQKRSLYVSFAEAYSSFNSSVVKAEKTLKEGGPEAAIAAIAKLKAASADGQPPAAPPGIANADPLDSRSRLERIGNEAGKALAASAAERERAADAELESARSGKAKEGADSAGKAAEGFAEAGRLFRDASEWMPSAASEALRVEAKAQSADELRKALVKNSLLSFSERMGEVFARSPSPASKLGDKDILAFNAETAAMISNGLSEFDGMISEYPDLLDPATVDRLRESARGLSARFARIESVIKTVKDRGKPVMPIIIGIFNPEPDDPQRSRPASFSGGSVAGSEWWWGIADIPKGLAQDLVITMSDSRPVRIYAAGLGSGGKRPASDLVNPLFKVGNSWPVLNAGARLDSGVFHIEVGPGRSDAYSGEAVVYKSFMMRTR
jgi:hypothetical protein